MKTKPTNPKAVKARVMWAVTDGTATTPCDYKGEYQFCDSKSEAASKALFSDRATRCFILPADAESVAQMREQVARAIYDHNHKFPIESDHTTLPDRYREMAGSMLAALSLTAPTTSKGGKKKSP